MHLEVEVWRRLASASTRVKERMQDAVIRKKIDILAMANMGRMMLHSLAILLLVVCVACTFRSNVVASTNAPLVQAESRVSSSVWWTLTSWLASSSLTRLMPATPSSSLQEGRDKDGETSLSSLLAWRTFLSWLASLSSSSSSMLPSSFLQKLQGQDLENLMLPGNSVQGEKDGVSISSSSSPSWWWFPSSAASSSLSSSPSAALAATGVGTTQRNESKDTKLCPQSCFRPNPVCGVDGVTYWCGLVDAECAGVEVDYTGFCEFDSKGTGGKGILAIQSLLLVHMVWLMLAAFLVFLGVL